MSDDPIGEATRLLERAAAWSERGFPWQDLLVPILMAQAHATLAQAQLLAEIRYQLTTRKD